MKTHSLGIENKIAEKENTNLFLTSKVSYQVQVRHSIASHITSIQTINDNTYPLITETKSHGVFFSVLQNKLFMFSECDISLTFSDS